MTDEEKVIERVAQQDGEHFANVKRILSRLRPGDTLTCQGVRCRVVPEEPTREMVDAANEREREVGITTAGKMGNPAMRLHYSEAYRAMLQAACKEPADG